MALLSVSDALDRVLAGVEPIGIEKVSLADAFHRVLAADLVASRTQPPADVSSMDGYAVRADDVATVPIALKLIGEVAAGRPFDRPIGAGEAVRIFTGGVIPQGADAIVIQENTDRNGTDVIVREPSSRGKHVRPQGLDFRSGDVLLTRGRHLTDRDVALIAAMNHPHITVYRRPKIALIATGDELVRPGTEPAPGQIVSSNAFALAALARNEGAEAIDLGIVPDSLDATMAAVEQAKNLKADVLMSSGGASVGDYDLIQKALVAKGMSLAFWRVALRPGRPVMHGDLGGMRVLGLPGNPVSAYVCAFLFLLPLIRRLSGRTDIQPITESALLGRDLGANDERTDYLRATLSRNPAGDVVATPHPLQDSSMLTPLAKADCLLIREPFAPAAHSGSLCTVVKFGL